MICVPAELLEDLAGRVPEAPARESSTRAGQSFDLDQWIRDRGLDVSGPTDWKGGRRWIFPTCPWNSNHDNRSAYILQLPNGAIAAGCRHNGCHGKDWHALRDICEPGWRATPRPQIVGEPTPPCSNWATPVPFHQFDLPSFPAAALPDWLREYVEAVATATQTPIDLAAMLSLAAVAAACAKKVEVRIKPDYLEPVNIFVVVALEPGARKSAVFKMMFEPLEEYDQAEARRTAPEIARGKVALRIKDAKLKKLQEQAVSGKPREQEAAADQAGALAADLAKDVVPVSPRYIVDDCTPEQLATILHAQGGCIAVLSPEGDVFDLMAGRYSSNASPNFGVFLKGHAGDQLRIDRVGKPPEFIDRPALTVGLAVQPDVIRGLMEKPGFRGRGLLGRFFYALPVSLLGRRNTNPPPVPTAVRVVYQSKMHSLLQLPLERGNGGEAGARELLLEPGARMRLQEFEAWIEPQLSEFGDLGGMRDWAGKVVGAVARIAGILHMAAFASKPGPWDFPISREIVESAIQVGKYLIPHAKAAFAEMGADPCIAQALMILRWIELRHVTRFTKRDLHQALRARFKRAEDLDRPLEILVSHYFVARQEQPPRTGAGQPPSPIFDVNPIWISQNVAKARAAGGSK